jgi:hypothetical protein
MKFEEEGDLPLSPPLGNSPYPNLNPNPDPNPNPNPNSDPDLLTLTLLLPPQQHTSC